MQSVKFTMDNIQYHFNKQLDNVNVILKVKIMVYLINSNT